ncbi:3-isopropylmalate dehydratase [Verticiella sediminum]|uniref:3-isopropylmalate dehydratase n=1 Tax=Verticiella sediminum TaxID=1247510 RepID=A0A556A804_9BURK|nr:3-isopropylmalate dehydratase [Verticiella sediminum]TSH89011.1 3-isopropylmalate dehydratase [Verticiella sediminum]
MSGIPRIDAGRAWLLGDDINTDLLAPGKYMKHGVEEIARHCLESLDPTFAGAVRPGDILFAGRNFGAGSSREQAVEVLRVLGVAAVVAVSFSGLYFRNGFNLGLPLLVCPEAASVANGARVRLALADGAVDDLDSGRRLICEPLPAHLLTLIHDGGLVPHLEKRLARERAARTST